MVSFRPFQPVQALKGRCQIAVEPLPRGGDLAVWQSSHAQKSPKIEQISMMRFAGLLQREQLRVVDLVDVH
jgi:hypothetical protein